MNVPYAEGYLGTQTSEALETLLRRVGHTDSEVKTVVDAFTTKQKSEVSNPVKTEAPAPLKKKTEAEKKTEAPKKKEKTKKTEALKSPKVTKAKTRAVKPRTSKE